MLLRHLSNCQVTLLIQVQMQSFSEVSYFDTTYNVSETTRMITTDLYIVAFRTWKLSATMWQKQAEIVYYTTDLISIMRTSP